ncbi:MAG TPA: hypothetical protein VJC05_04325 [Candidatus Andersenbacteria bacterium]|nr:hypothetical protein [Candidatus Andersenbacteria bacterium]
MNQNFWERSAAAVAQSLRGLTLAINGHEALMINVSPYERNSTERGLYKPMLEMPAGSVYCPRLMKSILLCIVTGKGKMQGSRVRIDDIEIAGRRYTGPGNVTEALGITVAKSSGTARLVSPLRVEVDLQGQPRRKAQPAPKRKGKIRQAPPLSEQALVRLMPQIVERWLKDDPPISLEAYTNALLEECGTEYELRKRIGS